VRPKPASSGSSGFDGKQPHCTVGIGGLKKNSVYFKEGRKHNPETIRGDQPRRKKEEGICPPCTAVVGGKKDKKPNVQTKCKGKGK